ncbi:MAG: hypothetical protein KF773_02950 [Deltaproteobacteria bacterium]|nr:hypothetical protein [Deltaproteobacteria bacterium]
MRAAALLVGIAGLAGCDVITASPDPGLHARMQVRGAEFRPGPFPDDGDGPATQGVQSTHAYVPLGTFRERVHGVFDRTARTAWIGIGGFTGSWVLPTTIGGTETPDSAVLDAVIGLSPDFPRGEFRLLMVAADEHGELGARRELMLVAEAEPPPAGELVVGLSWDGPADLDIHVVDPLGGEAWSDDPNTFDPKIGEPVDPAEPPRHGILDRDANRRCRRDTLPSEHVIWSVPPPPGEYIVRVDARDLCGAPSQAWEVAVYRCPGNDPEACVALGAARGVAVRDDVVFAPHGRGAGVLALRFTP